MGFCRKVNELHAGFLCMKRHTVYKQFSRLRTFVKAKNIARLSSSSKKFKSEKEKKKIWKWRKKHR